MRDYFENDLRSICQEIELTTPIFHVCTKYLHHFQRDILTF